MNNFVQSSPLDSVEFPALGGFSFEDFEGMSMVEAPVKPSRADSTTQYNIIIKRTDGLYRTLNILNTLFAVLAVLMIVATFVTVFYSLITITEVAHVADQVREHNMANRVVP